MMRSNTKSFVLLVLSVSVLLLLSISATAADKPEVISFQSTQLYKHPVDESKAPEGFRDLKWGQELSSIDGMTPERNPVAVPPMEVRCQRDTDKMFIGDVPLQRIDYYFVDNKLARVEIKIGEKGERGSTPKEYVQTVLGALCQAYGEIPDSDLYNGKRYLWLFKDVSVYYASSRGPHWITYSYLPAEEERLALIKAAEEAEKAGASEKIDSAAKDL